jgi:hypothetical protein
VVEDSAPAGHIGEMFLAEDVHSISIVLRQGEEQSTRALPLGSRVVREFGYGAEDLDAVVGAAVAWAESCLGELAGARRGTYPWRSESV